MVRGPLQETDELQSVAAKPAAEVPPKADDQAPSPPPLAPRPAATCPPPELCEAASGDPRSLDDLTTLRRFVQRLDEGIYITTTAGEILDANPALLAMFGAASLADLHTQTASQLLVDPEARQTQLELLERQGHVRDYELQIRTRDGGTKTVLDTCYAIRDPEAEQTLFHGILIDISDRKALEDQLRELGIRDPLTGLHNRRYLEQVDAARQRDGLCSGAILIDIDHFKQINDRFGHDKGDEVLVRMARYLTRLVRAEDAVIRMGGDEFLVLLALPDASAAQLVAKRLEEQATASEVPPFTLGWSVQQEGEPLDQAIVRADRQLIQVRARDRAGPERRRSRPPPRL